MYEIVYKINDEDYEIKVPTIRAARIIWDALREKGYHLVTPKPVYV